MTVSSPEFLDRARERRQAIQDHAADIGINETYLSQLVDTFYERVRAHPTLGPIFDGEIGDNWDTHLPKMKQFWSSVTMNTGVYSGKPVPAHTKLMGVRPEDFGLWLGVFEQTLIDTAPTQEAADYIMLRARRIAESLKLAMFGIPGLRPKAPQVSSHN